MEGIIKPDMELSEYSQYRETKLHEQPGFAYNTYLCTIPQDFARVALHWHEQMEFIYIKKGSGTVSVDLEPLKVHAGSIVPVMPGELHAIDGDPGVRMEYENIIFSLGILDSREELDWTRENVLAPLREASLSFPRPIDPGSPLHAEVSEALDDADAACEEMSSGYTLLVKSALFRVLYALYSHRSESSAKQEDHEAEAVKALLAWIRDHYSEDLTVGMAAGVSGYSPSHFMRLFKLHTGQTFTQFLNEYRLAAASYALAETEVPVSAVAEESGFRNLSYFIRQFKKAYGQSPRDYRKTHRA